MRIDPLMLNQRLTNIQRERKIANRRRDFPNPMHAPGPSELFQIPSDFLRYYVGAVEAGAGVDEGSEEGGREEEGGHSRSGYEEWRCVCGSGVEMLTRLDKWNSVKE